MVIKVILQSINNPLLDYLSRILDDLNSKMPIPSKFIISTSTLTIPLTVFDFSRRQYVAEDVNMFLYNYYKGILEKSRSLYVVGIVEGDGYSDGLNYVFGLATPDLRVASVYTARIRVGGEELFLSRLRKLILHELGHLLGLGHCENECVMRFSNSLAELDKKPDEYCSQCKARLSSLYG